MPFYEYHGPACGASFKQIVRFSEADLLPACLACVGYDTRKTISAACTLMGRAP